MTTDIEATLLPCPFCGGKPDGPVDATRILGVWRIVHRDCIMPSFSLEKATPEAVIAAWNTRHDPDAAMNRAETAEAALAAKEQEVARLREVVADAIGALDAAGNELGEFASILSREPWEANVAYESACQVRAALQEQTP